jgi:hypothetical protein
MWLVFLDLYQPKYPNSPSHEQPPETSHLDRDGIPNITDPDIDNDGIPNGKDRNIDGGTARSGGCVKIFL